jgi:hypothetical protein
VADHQFFFQIELTGRPDSHDMIRDLASHVLGQSGCGEESGPAILSALQTAVARTIASGASTCRLKFVVHDGRLDIAVSSEGGPPWQTSHPLA